MSDHREEPHLHSWEMVVWVVWVGREIGSLVPALSCAHPARGQVLPSAVTPMVPQKVSFPAWSSILSAQVHTRPHNQSHGGLKGKDGHPNLTV